MKLSFSTLACPNWSFLEIYAMAADLGYDGIEIRGIADQMYAPKIHAFSSHELEATKSRLGSLEIPVLTSGAYILRNPDIEAARREIEEYSNLAFKLGVKYIRVLVEQTPEPIITNPDLRAAAAELGAMCDIASRYGITLLTETNGVLADTKKCRNFLDTINRESCGVIWDVHHTIRFYNEAPSMSVENIGKYIRHVHLKDSVMGSNGKITYLLTGYGTIPFGDIVKSLVDINYRDFLSYEWVKRWSRELAEPGISLYQYINYLRDLI